MKNISCTEIQGAMYGFPRIHFSNKAIEAAHTEGVKPDFKYCMDLVTEAGVLTVPGSGFGQRPGSYHFRVTNLVSPTSEMEKVIDRIEKFNDNYHH